MKFTKLNIEKMKKEGLTYAGKAKDNLVKLVGKAKEMNNQKNWGENVAALKNVHFNFHHFVSVVLVSILAFFITFYSTGANTKEVKALSEDVKIAQLNKKAIDVNFGDTKVIAEKAREVLKDDVSDVVGLKTVSQTNQSGVYELENYMIKVSISESGLGERTALLTIENKEDYNKTEANKVDLMSAQDGSIAKGTSVSYEVVINLIDTTAPVIHMSSNDTTIAAEEEFDPRDYVSYVEDNADGIIADYTIEGSVNKDGDVLESGKHTLTIRAKDKSGNESAATLIVRVKEPVKEEPEVQATSAYTRASYGSYAASPYAGSIVAEARSHVGKAYVFGGNGPNTFDCSGLVQYVYARSGISVARTSSGQSYVGVAIDPNDISQWRAGDIVTFGPGGSQHAAIYSGAGTFIHALNPSQGVLETGLYGFGTIYAVRRVQ